MEERKTMNGKPVFEVPGSVLNMKSGFQKKLLCDGPTFTAGTACVYSCSFCYVPAAMRKAGPWLKEHGVDGKHEDIVIRRSDAGIKLHRALCYSSGIPKWNDPKDNRVIYGSPLVDVAANMDLVRETVDMCATILRLTNWQIRLLSKSNLLPKVAEALNEWSSSGRTSVSVTSSRERVIYGVSTGTIDDGIAKVFEEGCALPSKRIQSLHWLQDNGYRTFGMLCPVLPSSDYAQFAVHALDAIRSEQCEHVWAEPLNVRGDSMVRTAKALRDAGFNTRAAWIEDVANDRDLWESSARLLHHDIYGAIGTKSKLRFLQYTTSETVEWWKARESMGAVVL